MAGIRVEPPTKITSSISFLSNPEYIDIFNDYDTLRNNLDDFDTLKKL